ncbi:MAG: hypothetical protein GY757_21365, partial [bacterium]|nr:hypothetical protein [bacterium]
MDWSYRAQLLGYPILTAPRSEIYHKFGASMGMKSHAFKLKYIVGNRLYFVLKNLEYGTIKRYLLNYLIEDIKSSLIYLKRGNFSFVWAYKRGFLRLFLSLPGLLFKRWRLQKRRKVSDSGIFSKVAPLNLTLMEGGIPRLDVFSLRTNYGFLADYNGDACENTGKEKKITDGERGLSYRGRPEGERQVVWRLRPPRKNREAEEKIFMEFSFRVERDAYFDIHLLGIMRRRV